MNFSISDCPSPLPHPRGYIKNYNFLRLKPPEATKFPAASATP
jgi:hypothetical protein